MQRISGHFLYQVGANFHPLITLSEDVARGQAMAILQSAQNWLRGILGAYEFFRLRTCWTKGNELSTNVGNLIDRLQNGARELAQESPQGDIAGYWAEPLGFLEAFFLRNEAQEFETLLAAELAVADLYAVTKKRGFDTTALAENGAEIFPVDLVVKVPEAAHDAKEAGRCLAFELNTAAAFHMHRINEMVLRHYYDEVTGGKPHPERPNIAKYIDAMKGYKVGDKKVIGALANLNNLHRNPVIHPEDRLESAEDAVALLGSINASLVAMLKELRPAPLKLESPPSERNQGTPSDGPT